MLQVIIALTKKSVHSSVQVDICAKEIHGISCSQELDVQMCNKHAKNIMPQDIISAEAYESN